MAKNSGGASTESAASTPLSRITVAEFAETAFKSVMRAIEAQKFPHGPIIWGIIYQPQLAPGELAQPPIAGKGAGAAGAG